MTENKYKSPQASKQLWNKSTLKSILFCGLIGVSLIGSNEVLGSWLLDDNDDSLRPSRSRYNAEWKLGDGKILKAEKDHDLLDAFLKKIVRTLYKECNIFTPSGGLLYFNSYPITLGKIVGDDSLKLKEDGKTLEVFYGSSWKEGSSEKKKFDISIDKLKETLQGFLNSKEAKDIGIDSVALVRGGIDIFYANRLNDLIIIVFYGSKISTSLDTPAKKKETFDIINNNSIWKYTKK